MQLDSHQYYVASTMLVPQATSVEDLPGSCTISEGCVIPPQMDYAPTDIQAYDRLYAHGAQWIADACGLSSPLPIAQDCPEGKIPIRFVCEPTKKAESYSITAKPSSITITSATIEGAIHAVQTIRQIALTCGTSIPCFHIDDEPSWQWRGFLLDCSRHFFPISTIKKLIDIASLHHINRFHWHLTDDQGWRIPIDAYPQLIEIGAWRRELQYMQWGNQLYGGYYTHQEIRDVVAFAQDRGIIVVPEIETPGHASALLASLPHLGCSGGPYSVLDEFGIFDNVLCAGNDAIFTFLEHVFDTIVELFPSPYVHIGGDECPRTQWERCPRCQSRVSSLHLPSTHSLQGWVTSRISTMLSRRGKSAIGWDEILEGTGEEGHPSFLPQDVIVMSWRGMQGGIEACQRGHRVIMTPNTEGCYLDYRHKDSLEEIGNIGVSSITDSYLFSPWKQEMPISYKSLVLGGQGNLWTEHVSNLRTAEYLLYPRLSALAEALWIPDEQKHLQNFLKRIEIHTKRLRTLDVHYYPGSP